jgi:hypothetical protein
MAMRAVIRRSQPAKQRGSRNCRSLRRPCTNTSCVSSCASPASRTLLRAMANTADWKRTTNSP